MQAVLSFLKEAWWGIVVAFGIFIPLSAILIMFLSERHMKACERDDVG